MRYLRGVAQIFLALLFLQAFIACGSKLASRIDEVNTQDPALKTRLNGKIQDTDGKILDFADLADEPVVLMFASDTCLVCAAEAGDLSAHFQANGGLPLNAKFVTIIIGAEMDDAIFWKNRRHANWTVGIDPEDAIFRNYCREAQTPCNIVQNIRDNRIFKKVGRASLEELQGETGIWQFSVL